MAESLQHKLSRVRPPRVQITYDVEIGDAIERKELPFVIGVMADLSGKPAEPLPRVADRKFVAIDRDNFDAVMASAKPRLALRVPNRLQPDANDSLNVELSFEKFEDFAPEAVVKQAPALAKLFEARGRLRDLLTKLDGNDKLDALLGDVVKNTEEQAALKAQLAEGAEGGEAPAEEPKKKGK
jgi:type VI secretion system protein ImpB